MLILGIDDAGRGPIIGPMILAGALIDKNQEAKLKRMNIRDSKIIAHPERIKLSKAIKENSYSHFVAKAFPKEIDEAVESHSLNVLEAKKAAEIINTINNSKYQKETIKVILDCPSINTTKWQETLMKFIQHKENLQIICEHKADANHISVGAASILAKVVREEEVEIIKKKHGNIGSGYPADPITKEFIKNKGKELKDSGIFRKSWSTWKNLFPEKQKNQATLDKF
jgi:ribonuclease HII